MQTTYGTLIKLFALLVIFAGCGPKSDAQIFEDYKAKAEQGDAEAQYNLGVCYMYGKGVPVNITEAAEWWEKAAEQGYAAAQYNLGLCYAIGEGMPMDETKAVEWFQKAAKQGLAVAQYNLGICYERGNGIPVNKAKAVEWWEKAAAQGDAVAQYNLGVCYERGNGIPVNKAKAVEWYQKAAAQGDAAAQYNLGFCYMYGEGTPVNKIKAIEWWEKAAEQGVVAAQRSLILRGIESNNIDTCSDLPAERASRIQETPEEPTDPGKESEFITDTITEQQPIVEYINKSIEYRNSKEYSKDRKDGKKSYDQIQKLLRQEEYTKAIDVYEKNAGNILLYLGNISRIFTFHETIIELYQKTSDEERARERGISLREFNKAFMKGVKAFGGTMPKSFFANSNLLSFDYLEQKDYSNAIETMDELRQILTEEGDTLSVPFAIISANLGYIFKEAFYDFMPPENNLSDLSEDAAMIAGGAISFYTKTNEIYNAIPKMKYSSDNAEIILSLIDIFETLHEDTQIIQYTEQVQEIYEKNDWEVKGRYQFALTHLLILYLTYGEEQKAETLYNKLNQGSDKCPPLDEIKEKIKAASK